MKRIVVYGTDMLLRDEGQGACLLFAHGFPLDGTMWRHQLDAFASRYRVVVPDLRGFGGTGLGTTFTAAAALSMERFADDLAGLLDQLAINKVVFVGLSMGGCVAWQFARRYPDRVRALVLCDTRASADTAEAAANRLKLAARVLVSGSQEVAESMVSKLFAERTARESPLVVDAARQIMRGTRPDSIAAALRGLAHRPDMSGFLPDIAVPCVVIGGSEDAITPPEEMRSVAAALPRAEFIKIAGAGHMSPLESPVAFNEALARFLECLPD